MRRNLADFLLRLTGYEPGCMLTTFQQVMLCLIYPGRPLLLLACKVHDAASGTMVWNGVRIPYACLESWTRGPFPTKWIRFTGVVKGHATDYLTCESSSGFDDPDSSDYARGVLAGVGWATADCCAALDDGEDPRSLDIAYQIERVRKDLLDTEVFSDDPIGRPFSE